MKLLVKRTLSTISGKHEESIMAIFESPDSHKIETRKRANDLIRDLKLRDEAIYEKLEADYHKYSCPGTDWDPDKALELEYALIGVKTSEVSYSIKEFKTSPIVQLFLTGEDITKLK